MSELRARSAALDNPLLRLCLKCFAFGVDELGVIELDAYMHEALIPPPALMTVLAQALWERRNSADLAVMSTRCEGNRSGECGEVARRRVCHARVVDQQHPPAAQKPPRTSPPPAGLAP